MTGDRDTPVLARLTAANPVPDDVVREIVAEDWSDDLLARVFRDPAASDERVSPRRRKRERQRSVPGLAVGAAVLLATFVVAPALGLPQEFIKLFSSGEPAPPRTALSFSTLDRGAPSGLKTGVIPGTARKAFDVDLPEGARATLWVAPTARGGFCEMVELIDGARRPRGASGPGCDDRTNVTGYGVTIPGPISRQGIERGPVVVTGYTNIDDANRAVIRFADDTELQIQLMWISEPIDAGFFVYGVPPANWEPLHLPSELRFLDADGEVIGKHAIRFGPWASGSSSP